MIKRHNISPWYISNDKLELYKLHEDETFEVYTCSPEERDSCRRPVYAWSHTESERAFFPDNYASVKEDMDPYLIELHSFAKVPTPPVPKVTFLEV